MKNKTNLILLGCLILSLVGMVTIYIQFQHYKKMVNEWKSYSEDIEHRIMMGDRDALWRYSDVFGDYRIYPENDRFRPDTKDNPFLTENNWIVYFYYYMGKYEKHPQNIRDFIHEVFECFNYENENPSLDSNTAYWILPYLIFDADSNHNYYSCEDLAKWFSKDHMPCIKPNEGKSNHYKSMADSIYSILYNTPSKQDDSIE